MIEDYQAKRRRTRRLSRLLLGAGLVLALIAALATYVFATSPAFRAAAPPATTTVLVAARPIPARTTIGTADVRMVDASPDLVPDGALTSPDAAVGRIATVPIAAGEVILASKFQTAEGFGFSVFPPGQQPTGSAPDYRAMSLAIPDAQAVGGAVQPGDQVDLIFTVPVDVRLQPGIPADRPPDQAARITFEKVPILARTLTLYTIRIEAAQAERIAALLAGGAQLQLLLRASDDTRGSRATGALYVTEAQNLVKAIPR